MQAFLPIRIHQKVGRQDLSKERHGSDTPINLDSHATPRQQRPKRSSSPPKRKRSPCIPLHSDSKKQERNKQRKRRKRSPSSPSSSSTSYSSSSSPTSYDERSDSTSKKRAKGRGKRRSYAAWKKLHKKQKFKEGEKEHHFPYL